MEILTTILFVLFITINIPLLFYFLEPVGFMIVHSISPSAKKKTSQLNPFLNEKDYHFAAILTAHQDNRFIAPAVDSFLKQTHPHFSLYVVADDCDITDLHFTDDRIILLKPAQALHSKIKSIDYAVANFRSEPDVMIIFDSDNLVHPDYLKNLNAYFRQGFRVVQTHMLSKNTDSTYARLDSIGHVYYTFYERIVKMKLGLTSAILGLGIALETKLYREINYKQAISGFDKKLQSQLAIKVKQIAFAEDAIVYDEKVENAEVMEKQRTRWIFTYFKHFEDSRKLLFAGIKNLNLGQFLLGTTMLRPPMILLLSASLFMFMLSLFVYPTLAIIWGAVFILFILNFVWTIATQSRQKGLLSTVTHIPQMFFIQIKSLLKIKKAKKDFLKTEHKKIIYIDDILRHEYS